MERNPFPEVNIGFVDVVRAVGSKILDLAFHRHAEIPFVPPSLEMTPDAPKAVQQEFSFDLPDEMRS